MLIILIVFLMVLYLVYLKSDKVINFINKNILMKQIEIKEMDEIVEYRTKQTSLLAWLIISPVLIITLSFLYLVYEELGFLDGLSLIVMCVMINVLFLILGLLEVQRTNIIVTNSKIIYQSGILIQKISKLPVTKFDSIEVSQGIFGRFFNYGTVNISSIGGNWITLFAVSDPFILAEKINALTE